MSLFQQHDESDGQLLKGAGLFASASTTAAAVSPLEFNY
jgi:hypothetical protein